MKVLNFFGGAGIGKSTIAADVLNGIINPKAGNKEEIEKHREDHVKNMVLFCAGGIVSRISLWKSIPLREPWGMERHLPLA